MSTAGSGTVPPSRAEPQLADRALDARAIAPLAERRVDDRVDLGATADLGERVSVDVAVWRLHDHLALVVGVARGDRRDGRPAVHAEVVHVRRRARRRNTALVARVPRVQARRSRRRRRSPRSRSAPTEGQAAARRPRRRAGVASTAGSTALAVPMSVTVLKQSLGPHAKRARIARAG